MSQEDKIILEAISYLLLLFGSPFIYKVVYALCLPIWRKIFPVNTVIISIERDGIVRKETIELSNHEQLIDSLINARKSRD